MRKLILLLKAAGRMDEIPDLIELALDETNLLCKVHSTRLFHEFHEKGIEAALENAQENVLCWCTFESRSCGD